MSSTWRSRGLIAVLTAALLTVPMAASAAPSDETAKRIAELELQIATLAANRDSTFMAAAIANEEFLRAQETLDRLAGETENARDAAADAREQVEDARFGLGEVAQQAYQGSNPLESVAPYVSDADDFARTLHTSAYIGQIGQQRDATLSEFQALELVADTLETAAENAYAAEQDATADLEAKAEAASETAAQANIALLTSQDQRENLIVQLAQERQVEVEAERARQEQLDREREERNAIAAPATPAPDTTEAPPTQAPATEAPTQSPEPSQPTPTPAPAPTPTPTPTPTPAPTPTPTPTPTPAPTPTPSEPEYTVSPASGTYYAINTLNIRKGPGTGYASVGTLARHDTVKVTGKANGWFRIGTDRWVSGTYLSAGTPPKETTPDPPPTTTPPVNSSAVETAIAFAMKQVGKQYVLGGTGPNVWDCSGLTQASYRQAGISLNRSSSAQYSNGTKVPLAQAKRGDLLFWSRNGAQSGIYHVAIYLGNGQKVHAGSPSIGIKADAVYYSNIMPYVVRFG